MKAEIENNEIELIGNWVFQDNKVVEDETAKRINHLKENYLNKIAVSGSGWEILYQDPNDKRYWELIYTESDYHGGGAPSLINLSYGLAKEKYFL
jgi:hypothetical protein